jgi:hypothetical protein
VTSILNARIALYFLGVGQLIIVKNIILQVATIVLGYGNTFLKIPCSVRLTQGNCTNIA